MLLQQRVRVGKLEMVIFADRMVPHISWTGSFQLEEHRPMVRSLMSQMGCFTLDELLWVPSSWSWSMRSDLAIEDPKPPPHNVSFRSDKMGSMAYKARKSLTACRRRSTAGPSKRSTVVEPEGLGMDHLTCDRARVKPSVWTGLML